MLFVKPLNIKLSAQFPEAPSEAQDGKGNHSSSVAAITGWKRLLFLNSPCEPESVLQ